ncbi:melatonin receptor type 1B-A-like [Neodiprion virginianus]|uniref:Melatonin receptor type 1B-A-like n=1 Tax=Neodiprion lecontei TaxID=441921 RepID=A0A6J0BRD3_NEOLC|nr:melatonin receptor type 1B-A-like [Neodiprion lecontei]XP_046412238.1 melatonin receptor type 1B-A-like [Neodiprion fabricii]XP_046412239.1 melatonin receptor type 1B-A-like [Neodiprion fabricii]XP_046412240.1 melatonin receptor type 1B-A-like [Neodiprion fabricii]XP_046412241.1 melatonin receptor type 1B-A-like [Neodiprion fabricii]XP_046587992.1 melatonin receptor type 1B-A-like [Neodiprion lecontei]XP_046587993.1 melatonin receptor type 1B-A-like [Neodiprion lecontei]XP_046587994.1 mel
MNVTTVSTAGMSTAIAGIVALGTGVVVENTRGEIADGGDDVSPVTLSSDWSRVARLLLLASLAVVGSVGNVFMISAVMVEDHLKKRGNAFLVNVALADLLVTGLVIPASAIVILAGQQESPSICRFEWSLEAVCFLVTVFTLATIAVENYARLCLSEERYEALTPSCVTSLILTAWLIAGTTVALQSSLDLGPDFCGRRFNGIAFVQAVGASIVVGVPALITILAYLCLVVRVRRATRASFKPPVAFAWDYDLTKTNMYSFAMFAVFWLPFGVTLCVSSVRPVSARVFYNLAWFALSKSCFNNLLYCVSDRHFRNAYVKLFHYCCCKTTVSFSRRTRGDGTGRSSGDVRLRVHIIHSYASPASCRPAVARPNGRDVYEL